LCFVQGAIVKAISRKAIGTSRQMKGITLFIGADFPCEDRKK